MIADYKYSIGVTVFFVVILGVVFARWQQTTGTIFPDRAIDSSTYQVVMLDNGKTYFGKLSGLGSEYVELKDVYFIKPSWEEAAEEGEEVETNIALQRIRNQLYEPVDDMSIRSDHIISWQNLREDSQVLEAIQEFLSSEEE